MCFILSRDIGRVSILRKIKRIQKKKKKTKKKKKKKKNKKKNKTKKNPLNGWSSYSMSQLRKIEFQMTFSHGVLLSVILQNVLPYNSENRIINLPSS